ncbi:MAG: ATP phosphoribosyltransferase regulatory subunit [Paracoccaceae bacterium]|nr:ATP phosphoribosyltransferase regulatory subunit [Paracoccaceae bacterium]
MTGKAALRANAKAALRAAAERLKAAFVAAGAEPVEADILQPADVLLDLYGEDIRARAFVTHDPVMGEAMLRPDFTVPVARAHLDAGRAAARYAYAGEVFRQQETGSRRPPEFLQAGIEVFGEAGPAADAEVFALFAELLAPYDLAAVTGDIGLLAAAVEGLSTTGARKAALRRHLWRPRRFRALLERFSRPAAARPPADETALAGRGPEVGLRRRDDVLARLAALAEDAAAPPVPPAEIAALDALLEVRETPEKALSQVRNIAVDLPAIAPAIDRLAARFDGLSAAGVDLDRLTFEATYGRTTLEYYDGFIFGFLRPDRPDLPPVASGGRYDALARALGGAGAPPAIGGVIRPALLPEVQR